MTRIICRYDVCVFNRDNICTSKQIEYDPDQGCLTAQDRDEFVGLLDDEWADDEVVDPDDEVLEAFVEEDEEDDEGEDDIFGDGDLEEELSDEEDDF